MTILNNEVGCEIRMSLKKLFMDSFLSPFFATLAVGLAGCVLTYLTTDSFKNIPPDLPRILFSILILSLIGYVSYERYHKVKSYDNTFYGTSNGYSARGLRVIYSREYGGVVWDVYCPVYSSPSPYNIEIDAKPKCPKCRNGLEQTNRFFGGFMWKCAKCKNKYESKDNWNAVAEKVKSEMKSGLEMRM